MKFLVKYSCDVLLFDLSSVYKPLSRTVLFNLQNLKRVLSSPLMKATAFFFASI